MSVSAEQKERETPTNIYTHSQSYPIASLKVEGGRQCGKDSQEGQREHESWGLSKEVKKNILTVLQRDGSQILVLK